MDASSSSESKPHPPIGPVSSSSELRSSSSSSWGSGREPNLSRSKDLKETNGFFESFDFLPLLSLFLLSASTLSVGVFVLRLDLDRVVEELIPVFIVQNVIH